MGSMESAADSPFDPYDTNVLLAADVIYDVGKIPSLLRATRKFFLLTNLPLPSSSPPPLRLRPNGHR